MVKSCTVDDFIDAVLNACSFFNGLLAVDDCSKRIMSHPQNASSCFNFAGKPSTVNIVIKTSAMIFPIHVIQFQSGIYLGPMHFLA
jgi:hypothetical protein